MSNFSDWSFEQCVVKGNKIIGVKDSSGVNFKFINETTKEEFILGDRCKECGAEEVEANTPKTVYLCGSSDYDQRPNTFKKGDDCSIEQLAEGKKK